MKSKKEVSAGGIVFKNEGGHVLWLTTQHSQHEGWSFPKGLVGDIDKDESLEDAAVREVSEEGGIKASIIVPHPVKITYSYTFRDTFIDKTVYYFLMEYISGDIADHDWEVADSRWLTDQEIKKILTFKEDREAYDKILAIFAGVDKHG